jgi:uroporphyrinogen-III synthase
MPASNETNPGLKGLHVLTLESRRADLVGKLIVEQGGECFNAPSVRERPLEANPHIIQFAKELIAGHFDTVIFTTGAGTKYLVDALSTSGPTEPFLQGLRQVRIVSRGPKPAAVLSDLGVPVAVNVPEPNTWREVLDAMACFNPRNVAVQEYGTPNLELIAALRQRGANVTPVTIYRWDLPEDLAPLEEAVKRICDRWCHAVVFLSSVQLTHLLRIAERTAMRETLLAALQQDIVTVSIGPVMTDSMLREGLRPDFSPNHPKLGICIRQFAEQARRLVAIKRGHT